MQHSQPRSHDVYTKHIYGLELNRLLECMPNLRIRTARTLGLARRALWDTRGPLAGGDAK